ncbi:MAG: DUF4124 domain-containing protein [Cellvibrionaceae bacterium]
MKLFIKFIIFILVLGLAGPFIMKGPDGRPLMTLDEIIPDFSSMKRKATGMINDVNNTVGDLSGDGELSDFGKTQVYRWKDENGHWQFSDTPPPASQAAEKLLINPDVNIVQATELPKEQKEETPSEEETDADESSIGVPLPMTVSPVEARQLIDDAKGIGDLMQKRTEALNNITGDQ